MKKITSFVMALVITIFALTLTACGDKDGSTDTGKGTSGNNSKASVYETVSQAIENTLKAKSYDADVDTLLKTNLMGNLSEDSTDVNIKATSLDTDKPKVNVTGKHTTQGYTADQNLYYDGEWKYFDITSDGGYKMQCTFAEFAKEAGAPQSIVVTLPEALFNNAQSKNNDDGSLTVTLTADEATVESIYKDAVTAIVYDVVGEDLNQAVTKDATIVVTVADGYVRDFKISFVCEITAGNDKVTYDSSNSVTFVSCDKDVTVTAPANLESFYEVDGY